MKSCIIDSPTDICLAQADLPAWWQRAENDFATELMSVPLPVTQPQPAPVDLFATEAMPSVAQQDSELSADWFATELMPAVSPLPARQREQEEEWHTSFEQAISERAARVSQQLRRLSTTALDRALAPATDALPGALHAPRPARFRWREKRRAVLFTCLGICLFLLGFDLMGLLVALR
jgi:hypothetical protein